MNKIGTRQGKALFKAMNLPWDEKWLGIELVPIEPELTPSQNRGYWLLISAWLKMRPMRGVGREDLHRWVCCTHFGHIERELPDGRIDWIPIRTTTKIWDEDSNRYRRKKLRREQESGLIEFVYRTAAEGGVILPELETGGE